MATISGQEHSIMCEEGFRHALPDAVDGGPVDLFPLEREGLHAELGLFDEDLALGEAALCV